MRNCEKKFYSIELERKKNTTGTWKALNKILKSMDNPKNNLKCIINGKTVFNTPKDIANGFSRYFTEGGQSLSSNISSGSGIIYDYLKRLQ